ncbi:MAG: apolipoprotein N-acyltransferase [Haloferula sp.]
MTRLLLTLLAAGLTVLAYPPFHWHPLAAVSLIPLIFAIHGTNPGRGLGLGLLYGLLIFAGTLNWLATIFGPMANLLFLMLALFPGFFAASYCTLQQNLKDHRWLPWMAGILWVGVEYFRSEWFTLRFPWITPGTGLPPGYLTPVIGVYGMSLLVAVASVAIVTRHHRTALALFAVILSASYLPQNRPEEGALSIAAIQGEGIGVDEYLRLSNETEGPIDAFVWPEHSVTYDIRTKPALMEAIHQLLVEKKASSLTLGSRTEHDDGTWSNTAVTIGLNGVLGTHDKNRPVHFFDDGEPARHVGVFDSPLGMLSTPICFDNDYATIARSAVANGAELLLVPSMDAAHWTARQHLQHAEFVRHRAAENGRWVAVSSSSGMTQTVAPNGDRIAQLPLFDPGVLVSKVSPQTHRTLYNRVGWLIGPSCVILAIGLIIVSSILSRRRSPNEDPSAPAR